jgi:hypothetical protein
MKSEAVAAPAPDMKRGNLISGSLGAAVDVRYACNGIKRMASLGAAAVAAGADPELLAEASERLAYKVLQNIGFTSASDERLDSVLPMMLEASALVVADVARHIGTGKFSREVLERTVAIGGKLLTEVAKSRAVAKLVEPGWAARPDAVVALRMTTVTAIAHVAVEVADFDFMHPASECVKEASRVIVATAIDAAKTVGQKQLPDAVRLMLTQNLIQSGSKMYAAFWRAEAQQLAQELDHMSEAPRNAQLDEMAAAPLKSLLITINRRFESAFSEIARSAAELFVESSPESSATVKTTDQPSAAKRRWAR